MNKSTQGSTEMSPNARSTPGTNAHYESNQFINGIKNRKENLGAMNVCVTIF